MQNMSELMREHDEIVEEIGAITSLQKGSLNAQYRERTGKNGETATSGPYYVLTRKGKGNKTMSTAISAEEAPTVQQDVDNYKKFRRLVERFIEVGEKIAAASKKNRKSSMRA